ncbi:MAG TPA: DUF748 domain-containing protein [Candidatus Acidoferrum sp.]|nr:DUF748 domain-containing protein [Candidatus Acidoferrum sp.]
MRPRRWLALVVGLLVIGGAVAVYRLPELVRRVAVARIQAMTHRPVSIDRVELNLLTGRAAIHRFHLGDRDGQKPFADFGQLRVRVRVLPLLVGRLRVRELAITDSTVRVVRLGDGTFNFSDLVAGEGTSSQRPPNVTVERFTLTGGKVTLEDQGLPAPRTWTSEQITIDAHDLSTVADGGRANARSITAGAPVTIQLANVRLYPIHLQAVVTTEGLDLALARVYMPATAPAVIERGRVSTSMTVTLDARDGVRADVSGRFEDVVLTRPDGGEPLVLAPKITTEVKGFAFAEGALRLQGLAVDGAMSVRDPTAKGGQRFRLSDLRARVADLTWPATTPGRVDITTSVPGGGTLAISGTVQPPPDPSDLRLRLAGVNLASWAQFVPIAARITGIAEADLRVNEPLAAGIPARVGGSIAVNRLGVADGRQEVFGARRIELSAIEVQPGGGADTAAAGPPRVRVGRVAISEPRGTLERDATGAFPIRQLLARPAPSSAPLEPASSTRSSTTSASSPASGAEVGEIVVTGGAMSWRDRTVTPPARLEMSGIDARITGIGWPLRGAAGVRASLRPPGGGRLQLSGRVGLDPLSADLRLIAQGAELAPYQPYLPTTARVAGAADLDLTVTVPSLADARASARGRAALSRVDVRDGARTVLRMERANATGIDVDWPGRVTVERVALAQPWVLVERDARGGLVLRSLLTSRTDACTPGPCTPPATSNAEPLAVSVAHLSVEGGGARVVDQSVSPPFAVDLQSASVKLDGLSTTGAKPARLDLSGRLGPGSELVLRGTIGALGGPLKVDVNGELRDFAIPRTNPYLLRQVGWKSTDGRITSKLQCRIDGQALSVKTDIRLSQLQVVRAAASDGAQARIGLPLGVITSLMKNRRGDITLSLPVGGRLDDPRFEFGEAIWGAVRAVAVNAITLPVSWIGRVRFSPDSRIERIEVDPVPFDPGSETPTDEGRAKVTRLAAFLDQLPEVRMSLTPVVSSSDLEALRRRPVEAAIDQLVRQHGLSRDAAAVKLFGQRFPTDPVPSPGTAVASLVEVQTVAPTEIADLAARRLEAVRGTLKQAGIAGSRLPETKLAQREGRDGQVEANVLEPETPQPSKVREMFKRLVK